MKKLTRGGPGTKNKALQKVPGGLRQGLRGSPGLPGRPGNPQGMDQGRSHHTHTHRHTHTRRREVRAEEAWRQRLHARPFPPVRPCGLLGGTSTPRSKGTGGGGSRCRSKRTRQAPFGFPDRPLGLPVLTGRVTGGRQEGGVDGASRSSPGVCLRACTNDYPFTI